MAKDGFKTLSSNKVELQAKLQESLRELRNLRRRVAQQDLKNVREIRKNRQLIARLNTQLAVLAKLATK